MISSSNSEQLIVPLKGPKEKLHQVLIEMNSAMGINHRAAAACLASVLIVQLFKLQR